MTGLPDAYFPPLEKTKRIIGSYLQITLCIFYVSCVNAGIFYVHAYISRYPLRNLVDVHHLADGPFSIPTVLTNLALALLIQATNAFFMPFATRMTKVENHRTETEFEDQLIVKPSVPMWETTGFRTTFAPLKYLMMSLLGVE